MTQNYFNFQESMLSEAYGFVNIMLLFSGFLPGVITGKSTDNISHFVRKDSQKEIFSPALKMRLFFTYKELPDTANADAKFLNNKGKNALHLCSKQNKKSPQ